MSEDEPTTRRAIRNAPNCRVPAARLRNMTRYNADRAPDRRVNVIFRTSSEGRDRLKAIAAAHGVSVQTYLEAVAFGQPMGEDRPSGPIVQTELPLTG